MAGVLQEAGDADASACISPFLTFPHPLDCLIWFQGYHVHCVITAKDGGMTRLGVVDLF